MTCAFVSGSWRTSTVNTPATLVSQTHHKINILNVDNDTVISVNCTPGHGGGSVYCVGNAVQSWYLVVRVC